MTYSCSGCAYGTLGVKVHEVALISSTSVVIVNSCLCILPVYTFTHIGLETVLGQIQVM